MLFSDHLGRTEEQIKRDIEDRGGVRNGFTGWDRTFYFARVGKAHGLFALGWLYRIISPHDMPSEVVDRQREPVALEVGARPRQLFDWLHSLYLNPPVLRLADFWEREFGMVTSASRDVYVRRSLSRITRGDLRGFYDRYYVPSRMTLTVIGDFDRDQVFHTIDETFATLPRRPAPPVVDSYRDPGRADRLFRWRFGSNVLSQDRFKFYGLTRDGDLRLIFLSRFLGKRLNSRLRFGERKAVYGVDVSVARRGPGAYLQIAGAIKESEFAYAREVIEEELNAVMFHFSADLTITPPAHRN
jgi:predicted Zn-dependent peptidase